MFPKDIEDTRIAIHKAVSSITYGLNQMMEVANLSDDAEFVASASLLYRNTFDLLRPIGTRFAMQGWKPPKDTI